MRMKEQLPAVTHTHTHTHTLTQTEKVFTSRGNHLKYKATWWACLLLLLLCVLLCFSLIHSVTPVTALSNDKNDGSFYSILFSVLFLLLLYNQFQKTGSSYKGVKREKAWGKHGEENEWNQVQLLESSKCRLATVFNVRFALHCFCSFVSFCFVCQSLYELKSSAHN